MSSENPQQQASSALEVSCGNITCGSVERRRLYEELGIEDRVKEFTGEAAKAGRQAKEGDYEDEEIASSEPGSEHVDNEVRELVENTTEADLDE